MLSNTYINWDMLKTWIVRILPLESAVVAIPATKPTEITTEYNIAGRVIPPDIIFFISTFLTPKDLLSLTSVNQHGFENRFHFAPLLHLFLKNTEKIQAFLADYRPLTRPDLDTAYHANRHPNDIQKINQLTLSLSNTFTKEDMNDLVAALPNITRLKIELDQTAEYVHLEALLAAVKELPHLTQLHLSNPYPHHCQIRRLPLALWELTQLQTLELCNLRCLTALSPEIGQLTQLQTLILEQLNNLAALPPEIRQLTQLRKLTLRRLNNLITLPSEIWQLTNLQKLELSSNSLTALSPEIAQLAQLQTLELEGFTGLTVLPLEIGQLAQLQTLKLAGFPGITALPPEIWQLAQLQTLDLRTSGLAALPPEIWKLNQLHTLILRGMIRFTALPPEIRQLTQLQTLELGSSGFASLPPEIGQLTQLQTLVLTWLPKLTTLPPEIRKLTQLRQLKLIYAESFTALPLEIGQLTNLQELQLQKLKNLTTLPATIGQLTNLSQLILIEVGCSLPYSLQKQLSNSNIYARSTTNCTIL